MAAEEEEEELLEEEDVAKTTTLTASKDGEKKGEKNKKKGYVGMHSTGFRDFLLSRNCSERSWIAVSNIHPKVITRRNSRERDRPLLVFVVFSFRRSLFCLSLSKTMRVRVLSVHSYHNWTRNWTTNWPDFKKLTKISQF